MKTCYGNIFSYSLTAEEVTALREAEEVLLKLKDEALDALEDDEQINNENGGNFLALIDAAIEGIGEATYEDDAMLFIVS